MWGVASADEMNVLFFLLAELTDIPFGTGSLYVQSQDPGSLRRETRSLNVTEREEAVVVQYLALGGHSRFTGLQSDRRPDRILSAFTPVQGKPSLVTPTFRGQI
jgi:hypothetical protein